MANTIKRSYYCQQKQTMLQKNCTAKHFAIWCIKNKTPMTTIVLILLLRQQLPQPMWTGPMQIILHTLQHVDEYTSYPIILCNYRLIFYFVLAILIESQKKLFYPRYFFFVSSFWSSVFRLVTFSTISILYTIHSEYPCLSTINLTLSENETSQYEW